MSHSHDSEPEFEKLSKAITEAVMTSDKVRKIVEEIQKKDEICPQSFMVLVLKMQVLTESMELKIFTSIGFSNNSSLSSFTLIAF